jgi:hypothetical protein
MRYRIKVRPPRQDASVQCALQVCELQIYEPNPGGRQGGGNRRPGGPSGGRMARSALSARRRPFTPFRVILWQERELGTRGGGPAETAKIVAISSRLARLVIT